MLIYAFIVIIDSAVKFLILCVRNAVMESASGVITLRMFGKLMTFFVFRDFEMCD